MKEDISPQTSIVQVSAADGDFGLNGLIRYTLEGGSSANGTFLVDASLGIVRTNLPLDRELYASYEVIVVAVDRGTPPMSASVTVSVKVLGMLSYYPYIVELWKQLWKIGRIYKFILWLVFN